VTTDSLQLFFREAARHPLLTAEEEIELAKRIEMGDLAAKDRMISGTNPWPDNRTLLNHVRKG